MIEVRRATMWSVAIAVMQAADAPTVPMVATTGFFAASRRSAS